MFAAILAVIAGMVLSLTVFFKINVIQVKGRLEIYSREQIIQASGLQMNDNMFRFSAAAVSSRIMKSLPYVATVKVTRNLPNRVVIQITEAENALVLPLEDGRYLILSQDLDIIGTEDFYGGKCMLIRGITPVSTEHGKALEDEEEDSTRIENLRALIDAMSEVGMLSSASGVDVGSKLDIGLEMEGRVRVQLGTMGNLNRKMLMLREMMLNQIGEEEMGVLNLTVAGRATFSPMSYEEYHGHPEEPEEPVEEPVEEPPVEEPVENGAEEGSDG